MSEKKSAIVVGVDGSDSSIGAARWAGAVASKFGASLHIVHSLTTTGHFIADAAVIAIRAAASDEQREGAEKVLALAEQAVRQDVADVPITTAVVSDRADKSMVELSRHATLVVVGSDDVSPTAALLVGSTSLAVANHAACPIVVWRHVASPDTRPVVVGVDGTRAGVAALSAAFEYADRVGAPIVAVHSWTSPLPENGVMLHHLIDWEAVAASEQAVLSDALDEWTGRYPKVAVQSCVAEAKPGRALLDRLVDAQMVVVGNHRTNALSAAILGSTTLNLLHHSPIPVMVCRAT